MLKNIVKNLKPSSTLLINETSKTRYYEFFKRIKVVESHKTVFDKLQNIKYIAHYDTAIKIFKEYPIKKSITKLVFKVVSDDAIIFKGSVTANPVLFSPKSIATITDICKYNNQYHIVKIIIIKSL